MLSREKRIGRAVSNSEAVERDGDCVGSRVAQWECML
jgi:hypothetical protein